MIARRIASAAVAAVVFISACQSATPSPAIPTRLDALFSDLHDRGLFDGAVVVGLANQVLWAKGYGYANANAAARFTPDTPSDGASLAKTFTATILLMMEDEKRLDLDEPAQRLLTELPFPDVTLRHLLSHTSGLVWDYAYFDRFLAAGEVRTTEKLLTIIAREKPPLRFPPGTRYEYNSFGFDLAALVAERATGTQFSQLLSERIFRPLGISSAFPRPGRFSDFPGVRTLAYRRSGDRLELHDVFDLEQFHGGSNIYISAQDLHRWNASFLTNPLLQPDKFAQALAFARIGDAPSGLTLGSWYRTPDGSRFWYSGHLEGFHSEVFRDLTSRRSIVYVSNNTIEPWLQKMLVRAVDTILRGRPTEPLHKPQTAEISREDLHGLAGRWTLPSAGHLDIEYEDGSLFVVSSGVRYRMVQLNRQFFYVPGQDPIIGFAKDQSGAFTRVYVSSNVAELWGARGSKAQSN